MSPTPLPSWTAYDAGRQEAPQTFRPVQCLLLDDSRFDRRRVVHTANRSGLRMNVSEVATVAEARAKLKAATFDLNIFDLRLPDGDGITLAGEVTEDPRHKGVPTIILTGEGRVETFATARLAGCADYLTKDALTPKSFHTAVINALHTAVMRAQGDTEPETNAIKSLVDALLAAQRDTKGDVSALAREALANGDPNALPSALQTAIDRLTHNCQDISAQLAEIEKIAGAVVDHD